MTVKYTDIYEELKGNTFERLMRFALSNVPDDVNKREGSIIYNALAPLCQLMERAYETLYQITQESRFQTARGEYLDMRGAQYGVYRLKATHAQWRALILPASINIELKSETKDGQLFKSVGGQHLLYEATQYEGSGYYLLTCKEAGTASNYDSGTLQAEPLIEGTTVCKLISCVSAGSDDESDDDFRLRIWQKLSRKYGGGNFNDYKKWILEDFRGEHNDVKIDAFQVFPAWLGGGEVKIIATHYDENDGKYSPCDSAVLSQLKNFLDPLNSSTLERTGAGIVPFGHKITVETPTRYHMNFNIKITPKLSMAVDDKMRENVFKAALGYIEERRAYAVTLPSSDYPVSGYEARFFVTGLEHRIIDSDIERIDSVVIERPGVTGSWMPQEDLILKSTKSFSVLPYLKDVCIDGTLYKSAG